MIVWKGKRPGAEFSGGQDSLGFSKVGIITRVDEINMVADVKILTGAGNRMEVDLTQAMAGPRSFWGGIPEVDSIVLIGYRKMHKNLQVAVILGYLPSGNKSGLRFDPWTSMDPADKDDGLDAEAAKFEDSLSQVKRYKRLLLRPGDVGGMSSSGSELVLSKGTYLTNRAGDSFELREWVRSWIGQSIHRVETESGVRRVSGPIRRGAFYLPQDIFDEEGRLKTQEAGYFGRDELQNAGPGVQAGVPPKYALSDGTVLESFNDFSSFKPTVYSSGRRVHYVPSTNGEHIEDLDGSAEAFTEQRLEMSHTTNLTQEVIDEVDGFNSDRKIPYIEQVLGTVVGNDFFTSRGQRQYGRILKPKLFPDFGSRSKGRFEMESVSRTPMSDLESQTSAAAYLLRIRSPKNRSDSSFAFAVSKQGKAYLNIPGSRVEDYPSGAKNISAELNLEGALKAFLGASRPDGVSLEVNLEGGIRGVIGHNASGRSIDIEYRSTYKSKHRSNTPDGNGLALVTEVKGAAQKVVSGIDTESVGSKNMVVDGGYQTQCDRFSLNAHYGYSANLGEYNLLVSGKSQINHAMAVTETVVVGGKSTTILAGGLLTNVAAGVISTTAGAGAIAFNAPAGSFSATVGVGAISLTTAAGAVTLSAAAGAVKVSSGLAISLTGGLAINLTAPIISLTGAQVLLGGPAAVLGVVRGLPALPPGTPTLDLITNIPLSGSAIIRSI